MKSCSHDHWGPLVVAFYTHPTFSWKLYLAVFCHRTPGSSLSTLWSLGLVVNFIASVPLLNIEGVKLNKQKAIGYMVPSYYKSLCKEPEFNSLFKQAESLTSDWNKTSLSQSEAVKHQAITARLPDPVQMRQTSSCNLTKLIFCTLFPHSLQMLPVHIESVWTSLWL